MKFQKVYAEACEKKRAKEDIKREAELKLERAKKKEEKQAEKLRRYESYTRRYNSLRPPLDDYF